MFHRQKVVLRMLELAGRPVAQDELTHRCFLLRSKTTSGGGSAFYDFVPDRGVPHSFALVQELGKLEAAGLIGSDGDPPAWRVGPPAPAIEAAVEADVVRIVAQGSSGSGERAGGMIHRVAELAVYTAGYEGISIDRFLRLLVQSGIRRLIDVRNNPSSRRYGFHKTTLKRLTGALGIAYEHFPELGIPSSVRDIYRADDDRGPLFDRYKATTLAAEATAIGRVAALMCERTSVLVCMEADPADCHRSRLADPVSRLTGLPIVHLRAE